MAPPQNLEEVPCRSLEVSITPLLMSNSIQFKWTKNNPTLHAKISTFQNALLTQGHPNPVTSQVPCWRPSRGLPYLPSLSA